MKHLRTLAVLSILLTACDESGGRSAEVTIRNDILDKEYNVVVVDQVMSTSGQSGKRYELHPQEERSLKERGITKLRFSRKYQDHTRVYHVTCPDDPNKRILLKLIDVHLNRMPGGCVTTKATQ